MSSCRIGHENRPLAGTCVVDKEVVNNATVDNAYGVYEWEL